MSYPDNFNSAACDAANTCEAWTWRDEDAAAEIKKTIAEFTDAQDLQDETDCGLFDNIAAEYQAGSEDLDTFIFDTVAARIKALGGLPVLEAA